MNFWNDNPNDWKWRITAENIYDFYIMEKDRHILREKRSIAVHKAEKIIKENAPIISY